MRTRMSGGVGGAELQSSPLSRLPNGSAAVGAQQIIVTQIRAVIPLLLGGVDANA
jgi:hypothetical protein